MKRTGGAIVRRALEDEGIDLTFGALSNFTTWINKASHARW